MLNKYAVKIASEFAMLSDLKLSRFDRPHNSKLFAYLKLSTLESGFKKLLICIPDSLDTCGRKANPQRKSCRLKIYPDMCGRDLRGVQG